MKNFMRNYLEKLQQLLCLLVCMLMIAAVSIRRDGKVTGCYVNQQQTVAPKTEPMAVLKDGYKFPLFLILYTFAVYNNNKNVF